MTENHERVRMRDRKFSIFEENISARELDFLEDKVIP